MERNDAIKKLKQLENVDLVPLACKYDVTIWKGDKKNKGWAGHVLERYLGLPINSAQSPNFGSWELKIVPLKRLTNGTITVKETMAITMIDPFNVRQTPFEESHLLLKLKKVVVCARLFETQQEDRSVLIRVSAFDLTDAALYEQVKRDYEETRNCIVERGFEHLTGAMGILVQPRTKGAGHGSTSRAFYARTQFVSKILGIEKERIPINTGKTHMRNRCISLLMGKHPKWDGRLTISSPSPREVLMQQRTSKLLISRLTEAKAMIRGKRADIPSKTNKA